MKDIVDFFYRVYPYCRKSGSKILRSVFKCSSKIKNNENSSVEDSSAGDNECDDDDQEIDDDDDDHEDEDEDEDDEDGCNLPPADFRLVVSLASP